MFMYYRARKQSTIYDAGFFVLSKAEDVALLTQGKDDNKAQDKKDKLEMATVCVRGNTYKS